MASISKEENLSVNVSEKEEKVKVARPKRTQKINARLLGIQPGDSENPRPAKQRKKEDVRASKITASNDAATDPPTVPAIRAKERCAPKLMNVPTSISTLVPVAEAKVPRQELSAQKCPPSTSAPMIANSSRCTKKEFRAHNFLKSQREINLLVDCSKIDLGGINIDEMCDYIRTTSKVVNIMVERKDQMVYFTSREMMKKSYLKFVLKKFLKKQHLDGLIHITGDGAAKYELQYYTLENN